MLNLHRVKKSQDVNRGRDAKILSDLRQDGNNVEVFGDHLQDGNVEVYWLLQVR